MPTVLMKVLSNTLTFKHTVLAVRVVSLDNLDVISPAQKIRKYFLILSFRFHSLCCFKALPVFTVSKNRISCFVKASNNITLILHINELMAQSKTPPLQPALTELHSR